MTLFDGVKSPADRPRLALTGERIVALQEQIQTDEFSAQLLDDLRRRAEAYLKLPLPQYELEGRRLLGVSRRVLAHVLAFSLLFRLTDEQKFADAARREMLAAAAFPDWNPPHFLDTAEMAMALAIGYDWLHAVLLPDERGRIESALVEKALRPSFEKDWWWIDGQNNWNAVCHAGLTFAALAIAEHEPQLARKTIERAIVNIPNVAEAYGPDGAYDEGPMYWDYGSSFLVMLCAAMESATGRAFDPGVPGLIASADYMTHVTGPSGLFYNYSDCRLNRSPTAALFWLAAKLDRPAITAIDRKQLSAGDHSPREGDRLLPMALVWYTPAAESNERLPNFWVGGGRTPVALMRTKWHEPNASFLAIKAGSPSNSHAHMDVGSFVFESDGVRWAIDLPMQPYHTLEAAGLNLWDVSQASDRWRVLRNGADGHGILRFNHAPQAVDGRATMREEAAPDAIGRVTIDLGSLYAERVATASRTATLGRDGVASIDDHWQAGTSELQVTWQMMTAAEVQIVPGGFLLRSSGKQLRLQFEAVGEALSFGLTKVDSLLQPFDEPLPGVTRLEVSLNTPGGAAGRLNARFIPEAPVE